VVGVSYDGAVIGCDRCTSVGLFAVTEIPTHIHRYRVIDALGQGGMGTVYLARDPAIGRLIAIKLLKEEFDQDQRQRFEREAHSVGQLEHGNIVTIYDVGDHQGRPFIAMSYIPGETLAELIRRRAPLSLARKLRLVEELCAGLHAAHKAGIVHRDIKPANVMVDQQGVVKILDFGIARLASEGTQKTEEGTIIGSYNYMSPEQIVGKPLNHRSDIFAVGAIFYEVLSYMRAFPGTLRDGLWYRVVHEPPPPLRERCEDLDDEIERIVTRALEKEPDKRYQEIDHMRRDVARARKRLASAELDSLVGAAQAAMDDGAHEEALGKAEAALALDPDEGRALDVAERARKALADKRSADELAQRDERQRAERQAQLDQERAVEQQADNAARREGRQRIEEARGHFNQGRHVAALRGLDAAEALLPATADDLRAELESLRDRIEDALTVQILADEDRREAAERTAARAEPRPDYDRLHRIAETRIQIEAHLAKNELTQAEAALARAERDFPDQEAFATQRRRIAELRKISVADARASTRAENPTTPPVDPDSAPTVVVERPHGRGRARASARVAPIAAAALAITSVVILALRAC
jgi:eukaryotic-like serine/threonine-protein kinase